MELGALADRIRTDFPALERMVGGRPVAFFDGPAGSQVPRGVIEAVAGYLAHHNANTHGTFATSRESDDVIASARERMAAFLGADAAREIVFGANMTTMTFALSRALARSWGPRDEVIVTDLDHQANIAPWRSAAEDAGATVHVVPFATDSCQLDLDRLAALLGPRTRLVAVGYASNAVGTVNDVKRVASLAREAGALSFVDAVHYAPHGVIDVQQIGCDFLACSAYKFFGPHVGILWGREALLANLLPYKVPPAPDTAPERWETGTLNHEGIAGAAAAVEWIASLAAPHHAGWRERITAGMELIDTHERELLERILDGLAAIDGVKVFGPRRGEPRTPTIGMTVSGRMPGEVTEILGEQGIFAWNGDFYASPVVDRLGLRAKGGLVRIGLAPYNTAEEVDRLLAALSAIARA